MGVGSSNLLKSTKNLPGKPVVYRVFPIFQNILKILIFAFFHQGNYFSNLSRLFCNQLLHSVHGFLLSGLQGNGCKCSWWWRFPGDPGYCDEAEFYDNGFALVAEYRNGELRTVGGRRPQWLMELLHYLDT